MRYFSIEQKAFCYCVAENRLLGLLDKSGFKIDSARQGEKRAEQGADTRAEPTLNCIHCHHRITSPDARSEAAGQHHHTFANPYGIVFRVGCFREAPGVVAQGAPADFWSWFQGYEWQIVLCGRCKLHLGWRFIRAGDQFFGLILDRLVGAQWLH